jgi:hypothetical protein
MSNADPNYKMLAVAALRAKLDVTHPGFSGDEQIRAAFTPEISRAPGRLQFPSKQQLKDSAVWAVAGLYIRSWVLPLLDVLDGDAEMRDYAMDEGRRALAALAERDKRVTAMQAQSAEFTAVDEFASAYKSLPAVVDDDYPEARHKYESALKTMLDAFKANGRL